MPALTLLETGLETAVAYSIDDAANGPMLALAQQENDGSWPRRRGATSSTCTSPTITNWAAF